MLGLDNTNLGVRVITSSSTWPPQYARAESNELGIQQYRHRVLPDNGCRRSNIQGTVSYVA